MSERYDNAEKYFKAQFLADNTGQTKTSPLSKVETATCAYMGTVKALQEANLWK